MDTDDELEQQKLAQEHARDEEYYCDGLEALHVTERENEQYWAELLDAAERPSGCGRAPERVRAREPRARILRRMGRRG